MLRADFSAVLFDMDGTIADTTIYHNLAWIEFAKAHLGVTLGVNDVRFIPGRTDDIVCSILGRETKPEEKKYFHDDKENRFQKLACGNLTPIAGLKDYLLKLKAMQIKTALVTNAPRMNIEFTIHELKLDGLFDLALGSEDVLNGKPMPDPFLTAAKRLGVLPEQCLVYEDSLLGIASARAANCQICAVLTGMEKEKAIELGANWTIDDYQNPVYPLNKQ